MCSKCDVGSIGVTFFGPIHTCKSAMVISKVVMHHVGGWREE